jgi:hypothetical protein
LDLNIKFSDIDAFECTEELTLFDALDVSILHGWVVDPSDEILTSVLGKLTYNEAMMKLVESSNSSIVPDPNLSESTEPANGNPHLEEYLIRGFVEQTHAQISLYGLARLYEKVKERELSVLFHNNHFSVMFKFSTRLFLLVTDIGFSDSACCWELLDDIDG